MAHGKKAGRVGFLIQNIEEIVCGFLLASIIVVMFLDVVLRYLFKSPLLWTDEYTRLALIWMTFTGVIVAVKKGTHIKVDVLFLRVPRAWQNGFLLLGRITFMGFCALMIISGIPLIKLKMEIPTPALGWSWGLFYLPLVVSGVLVIFWILVDLFRKKPGSGS